MTFPTATTARLMEVSDSKTTLAFGVLVTAIKICLYRYTGAGDIAVATPIHQRYAETAPLNKMLVLRDKMTAGTSVKALLAQVGKTLSEAYSHQKYPFQRVLQQLHVSTPANRAPLFDVGVLMDQINQRDHLEKEYQDLTCCFSLDQATLKLDVIYRKALFEQATIETFTRHLSTLLAAMLNQPDESIDDLKMLTAEERETCLQGARGARFENHYAHAVQRRFLDQAKRDPTATALISNGEITTYGNLEETVLQKAEFLRDLGVCPGTVTGIYMNHGPDLVSAILAVMATGGAFLPINPGHPSSLILHMLQDANVGLVLVDSRTQDLFPGVTKTIAMDQPLPATAQKMTSDIPDPDLKDIAYILYTSGSTGLPKGVVVPHGALANYTAWAARTYLANEPRTFGLYSSIAFDFTLTSILTPLTTGNAISIYDPSQADFDVAALFQDPEIAILKVTPSHLALIPSGDNRPTGLKLLIVGGEALSADLAHRTHRKLGPGVAVYNEYGPTEATVACSAHRFNPDTDKGISIPLGIPADNCRVYVLDPQLRPLPENAAGEIYIAGMGLASGYLNRDELTSERFVQDPFFPGEKMYRTGDLARRDGAGRLFFLGRCDDQVKFHGHRVELDEIGHEVKRFPKIRDCVVRLLKDHRQNAVLVAYYVARQAVDTVQLKSFLSTNLVGEVLPNVYVHLKRLPLTLNGKVNHDALPSLEEAKQKLEQNYVAPTTEVEQQLADIWAKVLGIAKVGIHSNFFQLGGHSLLANQVISRLPEVFGVELPLRRIFEAPTVAELAVLLEQGLGTEEREDDLAALLAEVEQLSEEEVQHRISQTKVV